nr:transposase [Plesiomonas shigelloides]
MTKPASTRKTARKQYSPEFRDEALKLAERIGVAAAAREFSLYESQLYDWRSGGVNARKTLSFTRIAASSTAQRIIRHS